MSSPARYVSTGQLPPSEEVRRLVEAAYAEFRGLREGRVSQVYPALARVPAEHFGICLVGINRRQQRIGDAEIPFTLMSVSKPFVFALVAQAVGAEVVREKVGVNATGFPFNSLSAIERHPEGLTNPMVNSGAIATTSLVPGKDAAEKWRFLREGLAKFAGRELQVDEEMYTSARASNFRNQSIAQLLQSYGKIYADPAEALDLYTRQCCLRVTACDLATMGATLADAGVNPCTGEQVVSAAVSRQTLAIMATAGLYENSGDWLCEIGLPGKSGISGGMVTVSPGKGGLGTYAPLLDAVGNSVQGQRVARYLSQALGLDLFASQVGC